MDLRWAGDDPNRIGAVAKDLVGLQPDIILASSTVATGLISYGVDPVDLYRRAASYVDRILRGAKPGDLPVQFPTKFELVVNLKAAKAIGLTIPESLLLRADQVVE
jgi:ABC-type uncharacterized transport system substrate-binding protein